jgi:hypothetical protein
MSAILRCLGPLFADGSTATLATVDDAPHVSGELSTFGLGKLHG